MAELLQGLVLAKSLIGWIVQQAAILKAKGDISEGELARIKAAAEMSDAAWDAAVEAARERMTE